MPFLQITFHIGGPPALAAAPVCFKVGENAAEFAHKTPNYQGKINQGKPNLPRKKTIFSKEKFTKEKPHKKKNQGTEGQGGALRFESCDLKSL